MYSKRGIIMKTRNIFRNLLLASLLFTWFFGIGSWSGFFGFLGYGLIPADKPAVSASIASESKNPDQKENVRNQFMLRQHQSSKAVAPSDRIHVENNTNSRNRFD